MLLVLTLATHSFRSI